MTENTTSTAKSAKGDDRNLVAVDPTNAVTLEDRLFLIWKSQRTTIIGVVVVLLVAVVGWEIWKAMQRSAERDVRAAYGLAATPEARRAFIASHPGHPLSGLALLELADESYEAGNFSDAVRDYSSAADLLPEPALSGRARLGEGIAALKAGQTASGEVALRKLAEDPAALKTFRAQAWYELAAAAAAANEPTKARDNLDKLAGLETQGIWRMQGELLRSRLPVDDIPLPPAPTESDTATPAPGPQP